jgi:hypothetical protein
VLWRSSRTTRAGALFLEELDGVLQESLWILELRAVPRIWIDQELGVGDVLCQVPGIDRRDHDVVDAVQYQRRLLDRIQVSIRVLVGQRRRVRRVGLGLGLGDLGRSGWVLIDAQVAPIPERAATSSALLIYDDHHHWLII